MTGHPQFDGLSGLFLSNSPVIAAQIRDSGCDVKSAGTGGAIDFTEWEFRLNDTGA
jgi:hypothetical protein